MFNNFTAVILSNGKNSRIGFEKSLLKINGELIIDRTYRICKELFNKVLIISDKTSIISRFPENICYNDEIHNAGPLGGIYTGLLKAESKYIIVFACDMPFLSQSFIEREIDIFQSKYNKFDVFMPVHENKIEPLHAIYSKNCLDIINHNLKLNVYKIRSFFSFVKVAYWDITESDLKFLTNINNYQDLLKIINLNKNDS